MLAADRLPERIEVTAYYVVAEALTNAAKHSQASAVHVTVALADGDVRLSISDDGVGGADKAGSGLVDCRQSRRGGGRNNGRGEPPRQRYPLHRRASRGRASITV